MVLADEHSRDAARAQNAGRITPALSMDEAGWTNFTRGAERIASAVLEQTGLRTVFHHHCGGYVETPAEIAEFLARTDPTLIGLVYDTGHALYGSGGSDPATVLELLNKHRQRLWYVHFKDMSAEVAARARQTAMAYRDAVGAGVFCELGQGVVPFGPMLDALQASGYAGWVTVEQDVLPGMGEPLVSATFNRQYLRTLEEREMSA